MAIFKRVKTHKIAYGGSKKTGGHSHRFNRGDDCTPSQKSGDEKRRKK